MSAISSSAVQGLPYYFDFSPTVVLGALADRVYQFFLDKVSSLFSCARIDSCRRFLYSALYHLSLSVQRVFNAVRGQLESSLLFSHPQSSSLIGQPLGITNQGNTCWLAALLQLSLNAPFLEEIFRDHALFEDFFRGYRSAQARAGEGNSELDVDQLRQYLHELTEKGISKYATQEDPALALESLMQRADGLPYYTLFSTREGADTVVRREPFLGLDLPLRGGDFASVMKNYFYSTTEEGRQIRLSFTHLPNDLLIQMKRFTLGIDPDSGELIREKKTQEIAVPFRFRCLPQTEFEHQGASYCCKGFIQHLGRSNEAGHYVAFVQKIGKWWRCDDSTITEVDMRTVKEAMRTSYMYHFMKV